MILLTVYFCRYAIATDGKKKRVVVRRLFQQGWGAEVEEHELEHIEPDLGGLNSV